MDDYYLAETVHGEIVQVRNLPNTMKEPVAQWHPGVMRALSEKSIQTSDYGRGQRDMLNAILALNPKAAQRLHMVSGGTEETFDNHEGRLPFDLVFWVTEVAEQLGIEPKGE
jgi:hypothetical protein